MSLWLLRHMKGADKKETNKPPHPTPYPPPFSFSKHRSIK